MGVEFLPFRIAGRDFAVDASRVREITPFEGSRQDIPVFDLRKRLGLPPVFYGRHPILIVLNSRATDSGVAGFAADYVSDLISGSRNHCRGGKLKVRGRPRWILDADTLRIER